jgi:proteasome lid subunit RPN8/RPN11
MAALHMDSEVRRQLELLVSQGYPHETCGVMVGSRDSSTTRVERIYEARNLNTERANDRYELNPDDFLKVDEEARKSGKEIVGIWHSHPDHPARPSETDREAAWEGWSYVIVSVSRDGIKDFRSWRLNGSQFVEETVQS